MINNLHIYNNNDGLIFARSTKESNAYCNYIPFYILKQYTEKLLPGLINRDYVYNKIYSEFTNYNKLLRTERITIAEIHKYIKNYNKVSHYVTNRSGSSFIISPFNLEAFNNFRLISKWVTLYSLVIPVKYLPYVKICLMLEEPIDPKVYEFWIKDDFDITKTEFIHYRKNYKKYLLPDLKENNIPIIIKKDIDKELYFYPKLPNFKSISEYNKYTENLIKEGLHSLRIENNIHENFINISGVITQNEVSNNFSVTNSSIQQTLLEQEQEIENNALYEEWRGASQLYL